MIKYLLIGQEIENLRQGSNDENSKEIEQLISRMGALKSIFIAQDGFQRKALKEDEWWLVNKIDDKPVNYNAAILAEVGELLESSDYEWWATKNEKDKENMITELIDVLHFELSKSMSLFQLTHNAVGTTEDERIYDAIEIIKSIAAPYEAPENKSSEYFYNELIDYIRISLYLHQNLMYSPEKMIQSISEVFKRLFLVLSFLDVDFEEVISRYNVKNALNFVRKANGYKEGTYIKSWIALNGVIAEDNVIALELVKMRQNDSFTILTIDEIKDLLDDHYRTIVIPSV
jgi:dimeric dUTPase (all-alpha-NTP-PPase superfamily)